MREQAAIEGLDAGTIREYEAAHVLYPWVAQQGLTLAMAAGVATMEAYRADGLIERTADTVHYLLAKACELQERHPSVGDVRGKGLFVGLELVSNRSSKEPAHDPLVEGPRPPTAKLKVLAQALRDGVYCLPAPTSSVLMFAPPISITRQEIDHATAVFDRALAISDAEVLM